MKIYLDNQKIDIDISKYALKEDIHNHDNKNVLDQINESKINQWNNALKQEALESYVVKTVYDTKIAELLNIIESLNKRIKVLESDTPEENIPCTSITINQNRLELNELNKTYSLIATVEPSNTTDTIIWQSSSNAIASVSNGIVTSVGQGDCIITAICGSIAASCHVTVDLEPEDLDEGILLYKAGTQYKDTEFRNLCLTNASNSLSSNAICYELNVSNSHAWFSYDGYVNFDDYDRVEITAYTEHSTQQPALGLGITSKSGQCGYEDSSEWEGTSHTNVTLMYNVTETKYSLPINHTGSGYLLIWMNHASSALGRVYITEIRVIPKKTGNE